MTTTKDWKTSFDKKYPPNDTQHFGWGIKEPIDIKDFITQLLLSKSQEICERLEKKNYKDEYEDVGGEAIANHAYNDKFEAFRYGYNQSLSDAQEVVKSILQ